MPEDAPPEPLPEGGPGLGDRLKGFFEPVTRFHFEHPVYFWLAVVGTVAAGLALGAWLAPELVVDRFLWENFWGPTQTDAEQVHTLTRNGVQATEDYTLLSEIIYGIILAGVLVSIYIHLFDKRGISVDARFIASLTPYVFFGPLARSMEDASVFCQQSSPALAGCDPGLFSWLFISPFIYVLTAAAVIAHLLLAYKTREDGRRVQLMTVSGWLGIQAIVYGLLFYGMRSEFVIMIHPLTFVGLAVVAFGVYAWATSRGGRHQTWSMVSWGLPMTLVPVVLIATWEINGTWLELSSAQAARVAEKAAPESIWITLGLTAIVLLAVAGIAWLMREDSPTFGYFLNPLNLGLIGGHMIDAFATFTAICSDTASDICSGAIFLGVKTSGYGEKHPVSEFFLGFADGWGFPIMKLLLVVVIIVLIDRAAEEGDEDPNLIGLVKLAVLVLGLAPGVRDLARVSLGI